MKKSICIAIAMLAAGSAFQLFAEDACPNPTLKPFQTKALEDAKTVASPDFVDHHMAFSADQAECNTEERRDNVPSLEVRRRHRKAEYSARAPPIFCHPRSLSGAHALKAVA